MGRTTQAAPQYDEPDATVGTVDEGVDPQEGSEDAQNGGQEAPATDSAPDAKEHRSNGLRAAYGEATATLREKHRTEFDALYVAAARKRGIDYKPKPTPEQAAEAELDALIAKFPHLKDKVLRDEGVERA
jgi:hypothetical protein